MARIRSIKPEFFTSEQVVECSPTARLLFVGMWCFCDDGGVHPASAKRLKMEIFPGDKVSETQVLALVKELVAAGLVIEFSAEGKTWWGVTGWHHQKIDKPSFRYPRLPVVERSANGCVAVADASPPEGKGEDRIGEDISFAAGAAKRFVPPTEQAVQAYCLERRNGIDAAAFVAHYAANGWRRGNTPIKDWKACVITWERRATSTAATPKKSRVYDPKVDGPYNPHAED